MIIIYFLLVFLSFSLILKTPLKHIENTFMRGAIILFFSSYLTMLATFVLSCLLAPFTSKTLLSSTSIIMLLFTAYLVFHYDKIIPLLRDIKRSLSHSLLACSFLCLLFAFFFLFFSNHSIIKGDTLLTSQIYWDFHWHVRLINNFAFGNNFLPQNESIAGTYNIYHYFWALLPATYEVLGLNLATAINLYSALFLTAIFLFSFGIIKEYAESTISYLLVPLALVTHGSLYFITLLPQLITHGVSFLLYSPRPDLLDFSNTGQFGYNGNMFNMFYFIEERQLLFAIFGMLIFIYILLHIEKFSTRFLFFSGIAFGFFLQWHLFVSIILITIGCGYTFFSFFFQRKQIKPLLYFVLPATSLLLLYAGILKWYTHTSPDFLHLPSKQYPQLNFTFSTMPTTYPLSLIHFLLYWVYAYGVRIILYSLFLFLAWKKNMRVFYISVSMLPVFLLINAVQLSPLSIYDNHKWLKPFNVFFDLFSFTYVLSAISNMKSYVIKYGIIIPLLFFSFFSGTLSVIAYFAQSPDIVYAHYDSPIYQKIAKTSPTAVFLTDTPKYVFLAGRKTYLADYLGGDLGLDVTLRQIQQNTFFSLTTREKMCNYLKDQNLNTKIQYVFSEDTNLFFSVKECL